MPLNLDVPLNGVTMHLRLSEVEAVAVGSGAAAGSIEGHAVRLIEALRNVPATDRAPTWELVVRHIARRAPLPDAAGAIGMDALHARDLLAALDQAAAAIPALDR